MNECRTAVTNGFIKALLGIMVIIHVNHKKEKCIIGVLDVAVGYLVVFNPDKRIYFYLNRKL